VWLKLRIRDIRCVVIKLYDKVVTTNPNHKIAATTPCTE